MHMNIFDSSVIICGGVIWLEKHNQDDTAGTAVIRGWGGLCSASTFCKPVLFPAFIKQFIPCSP